VVKLRALIEVFVLSFVFNVNGFWQVVFNNKRVDYYMTFKPLHKKKKAKKQTDQQIFLDFMARNT